MIAAYRRAAWLGSNCPQYSADARRHRRPNFLGGGDSEDVEGETHLGQKVTGVQSGTFGRGYQPPSAYCAPQPGLRRCGSRAGWLQVQSIRTRNRGQSGIAKPTSSENESVAVPDAAARGRERMRLLRPALSLAFLVRLY